MLFLLYEYLEVLGLVSKPVGLTQCVGSRGKGGSRKSSAVITKRGQ